MQYRYTYICMYIYICICICRCLCTDSHVSVDFISARLMYLVSLLGFQCTLSSQQRPTIMPVTCSGTERCTAIN